MTHTVDVDGDDAELLRVAIGERNGAFYERYLEAAGGSHRASWNWPAFFVSSFWLLYRKLWIEALGYILMLPIAIGVVAGVPLILLDVPEPLADNILLGVSGVFSFLLMPLYANALYAAKLRRLIRRAREIHGDRPAQEAWLARHGGTSWAWLILLIVPVIGILAAMTLPAYQDYARSARSVPVRSHYEEAVRTIRADMAAAHADVQLGRRSLEELEVAWRRPGFWVERMNDRGWTSPGGDPAFATIEVDQSGVVGIRADGSLRNGTYAVTVSRPQYGRFAQFPVERTTIRWRGPR